MTTPVPTRRPVFRASWFAARARNATHRGPMIASIGAVAVLLTVLVLVLVPREVDRAIRAQADALPPPRDTVALLGLIEQRRAAYEQAEERLRTARRADSVIVSILARAAASADSADGDGSRPAPGGATGMVVRRDVPRDAESADLQQRLTRARAAPLLESYRELAQAAPMRADPRVRAILDSLEQVDREREAYAALGGPDARYAALSAQMTALGQRLIRVAEANLARATAPDSPSAAAADRELPVALSMPRRNQEELQALAAAAAAAQREVGRSEQAVEEARQWNAEVEARRTAILSRANLRIPQLALVMAALVLGVVVGFAGAMGIELKTPRVADAAEAERVSDVRVIVDPGASSQGGAARRRRRADRSLPPSLDGTGEAYHLLHFTLTGVWDVARRVRINADSPLLAASAAANLAAAAAREARAVLLVDLDLRSRMLAELLQVTDRRGVTEVLSGEAEVLEVLRDFAVGRDVYMAVICGGHRGARGTTERRMIVQEDLDRLSARHDLTVVIGEERSATGDALLPAKDVILCVRAGVTPIAWLAEAAETIRAGGDRLRAVLLWTGREQTRSSLTRRERVG
jgi:hypothetical protein